MDDKRFGNNLFLRIEKNYFASPTCHKKSRLNRFNSLKYTACISCASLHTCWWQHHSWDCFSSCIQSCILVLIQRHHPMKFNSNTQEHKDRGHLKLPGCVLDASNRLRVHSVMVVWQERSPRESKTVLCFLRIKKLPYLSITYYLSKNQQNHRREFL